MPMMIFKGLKATAKGSLSAESWSVVAYDHSLLERSDLVKHEIACLLGKDRDKRRTLAQLLGAPVVGQDFSPLSVMKNRFPL